MWLVLQLSQCQDRMLELERSVENPHNKERVRVIEGKDLKPAELHAKIEEVSDCVCFQIFVKISVEQ